MELSYIFSKKKFFLYFGKWNFLASTLKIFLYFLKKSFSYILGNETFLYFLKKSVFLYFAKWNFLALRLENFWDIKLSSPKRKETIWDDC